MPLASRRRLGSCPGGIASHVNRRQFLDADASGRAGARWRVCAARPDRASSASLIKATTARGRTRHRWRRHRRRRPRPGHRLEPRPIGRHAWSSNGTRPTPFAIRGASSARPRSRTPTSPPASTSPACRAAQRIVYRVRFQDLARPAIVAASRSSARSSLPSARARAPTRDVTVAWYGRLPAARAGASTRRAAACGSSRRCAAPQPDVFIHLGDTIYADQPIVAGGEARRRHALAEPRHAGEDASRRRRSTISAATTATTCSTSTCGASTPRSRQIVLWDDHEVRKQLVSGAACSTPSGHTPRRASPCSRRGRSAAFLEYQPMRFVPAIASGSIARVRLRPARRSLRLGHAQLPRAELEPTDSRR